MTTEKFKTTGTNNYSKYQTDQMVEMLMWLRQFDDEMQKDKYVQLMKIATGLDFKTDFPDQTYPDAAMAIMLCTEYYIEEGQIYSNE